MKKKSGFQTEKGCAQLSGGTSCWGLPILWISLSHLCTGLKDHWQLSSKSDLQKCGHPLQQHYQVQTSNNYVVLFTCAVYHRLGNFRCKENFMVSARATKIFLSSISTNTTVIINHIIIPTLDTGMPIPLHTLWQQTVSMYMYTRVQQYWCKTPSSKHN